MKILIVSASDLEGGASRCAFRLHRGLVQIGIDAQMLVWNKSSHDDTVIGPSKRQKAINFLQKQIEKNLLSFYKNKIPYANYSSGLLSYDLLKRINEINPDIVNLHWICSSSVGINTINKIRQPVVWSLHDMWAFTGGCHYDYNCRKYTTSCGACPLLGSSKTYDLSKIVFNQKKRAFSAKKDLFLVPSSNWLRTMAEESVLLHARPMEVIHTGLNLNIFKPLNKKVSRQILNLPQDRNLVLFGSLYGSADERKGFSFVVKTMNLLKDQSIDLVLLGNFHDSDTKNVLEVPVHNKGVLQDEETIAVLYSAVDVLLLPSIQENLANICLEGLACGTPVVAFETGGNLDMITHQINGYLAQPFDTHELVSGIQWILESEDRLSQLSSKARECAENKFNMTIIAHQYQKLFNKIYHSSFSFKEIDTQQQNTLNISVTTPSCE